MEEVLQMKKQTIQL